MSDFIDGFQLAAPPGHNGRQLQRLLKEQGLDVRFPVSQGPSGKYWVQLQSGPFDLLHNIPLLKAAVEAIREQ